MEGLGERELAEGLKMSLIAEATMIDDVDAVWAPLFLSCFVF